MIRDQFIQACYLLAGAFFILGLRGLTHPTTARRGLLFSEVAMLLAVVGTLLHKDIVRWDWILLGLAVGAAAGAVLALKMPMTKVPELTALSHMFGALAATLVGVAEFHLAATHMGAGTSLALTFEVLLGSVTITGSLMAFAKLQELVRGAPITYPLQNATNLALLGGALALGVVLVIQPDTAWAFYTMIGMGLLAGVLMVLPIGGADMPVVIALLNSYAGLAAAATGFVLENNALIIVGALDGASGFILSVQMSKAMNRSFGNVLFGAFGSAPAGAVEATGAVRRAVRTIGAEDLAVQLAYAHKVIIVPGYGMAVAQAQHEVRELSQLIEARGGEVSFAVHPVAGRMPGHMNVLLAEANVPYDKLKDMDEINAEFERCDVALVIGANDVVNPAARTDTASPIYGMPILDVDRARSVVVVKRGMSVGFAGIDNALFYTPKTMMYFGDAKKALSELVREMRQVQ